MTEPAQGETAIVLDACVLYPAVVRSVLLASAAAGLFQPIWSPRILDEWRTATARKQGADAAALVENAIERMKRYWPASECTGNPAHEIQIKLPDPADAHVVATALEAKATAIVTFNLRDFPARILTGLEIEARHPDGFLWELLSSAPEPMTGVVAGVLSQFDVPPERARSALKRSRLPRLGKAWQTLHG